MQVGYIVSMCIKSFYGKNVPSVTPAAATAVPDDGNISDLDDIRSEIEEEVYESETESETESESEESVSESEHETAEI